MKTILIPQVESYSYRLKTDEKIQFIVFLTQSIKQTIQIDLDKPYAEAEILGLIIGENSTDINLTTLQNHCAIGTVSNLIIKTVLSEHSHFKFSGLIKIAKNAQKSDAYQKNENLILGDDVNCDSKPYLEILANDVRCTHGVTMGNIDKDQLFYLETRGVNQKTAEELIIDGFLHAITKRITDNKISAEINAKINKIYD